MKPKVLFIDRDGTLIAEPPSDYQIDSLEKLEFIPGVFRNLFNIRKTTDYKVVLVSNQDGLGTDSFPEKTFTPAHEKFLKAFENEGVVFDAIHIDPSMPADNSPNRKPGTGMLKEYMNGEYDLENSFVIGDRITDLELAKNIGSKGIMYGDEALGSLIKTSGFASSCSLLTKSWDEIAKKVRASMRSSIVSRNTNETSIEIKLSLDGTGEAKIKTGLGFFDHMLEQIARHGNFDLQILVNGDLHVDEHHTIEDTALALGEAFLLALGDKKGIYRYGFTLPMDDSLAQVAIDFGGRPWLIWEGAFTRENVGEVPTEMFYHFFKSFSDTSKTNLNIKVEGDNDHHKIEGVFKAFSKALRGAVAIDPNSDRLPSTKGSL
ncbi:MAG: bifunctional histidinol-phosphatase/imidazoleglycerol-phosphate dehydratase HisB [Bacteroidales bacterium]|jgi:imidazoleglycerol-phosphate dehydratase/histidinol-phosphatase|nr:bifunctional histidinol-phosphatase/imidazoleglycerol-phosphate dehydratase HisB [Bacteroidales bacterium]